MPSKYIRARFFSVAQHNYDCVELAVFLTIANQADYEWIADTTLHSWNYPATLIWMHIFIPPRQKSTLLLLYRAQTNEMKCAVHIRARTYIHSWETAAYVLTRVRCTNELRALNGDFVIGECIGSSYIAQQRHHHLEKNQGHSQSDQPNSIQHLYFVFVHYIMYNAGRGVSQSMSGLSARPRGGCAIL